MFFPLCCINSKTVVNIGNFVTIGYKYLSVIDYKIANSIIFNMINCNSYLTLEKLIVLQILWTGELRLFISHCTDINMLDSNCFSISQHEMCRNALIMMNFRELVSGIRVHYVAE